MIEFTGVTVAYGANAAALSEVSFRAPRGELTALVGPNGSGKTTAVRALLGRVGVSSGSIAIDGARIGALSRREAALRVAVVAQREEPVFPLAVAEYVALGRYAHVRGLRGIDRSGDAEVAQALREADVGDLAHRRTDELSGGEWQRVRMARALAQATSSLVLDEPTTFLDVGHEMAQFELLASLAASGRAVLVISHQLNLVARFATTMVLLHRGRVAAAGVPDDVMRGDVLERVYGWPLVVSRDPAVGAPTLVPLRASRSTTPLPPNSR